MNCAALCVALIFSRLLGRTGIAYTCRSKYFLLTDWYNGESLHHNRRYNKLLDIAFNIRFRMALDVLRDIAILHQHQLIHGDIKSANVMLDGESAKLVDLDGVFMMNELSLALRLFTREYLDKQLSAKDKNKVPINHLLDKKSDIYALAKTIAQFFPELFAVKQGENSLDFVVIQNHAVVSPIMGMMAEDSKLRPSTAEIVYLEFIKIGKREGILPQDYQPKLCTVNAEVESDLIDIEVEISEFAVRIQQIFPGIVMYQNKQSKKIEYMNKQDKQLSNGFTLLEDTSNQGMNADVTGEFLMLMNRVIKDSGHQESISEKYILMREIANMIPPYNSIPTSKILEIAKIFFHLTLQRNSPGTEDETKAGRILCKILNYSELVNIRNLLFPNIETITYKNLREFVCGHNDVKLFSFFNRGAVIDKFDELKPTVADLGDTFKAETLRKDIRYRTNE